MLTTSLLRDKIIEIFVEADDFCKEFDKKIVKHQFGSGNNPVKNRKASLSDSGG